MPDGLITDYLSTFDAGTNSGFEPLLLPKNQTAWSVNTTFRDGFATDRPPYFLRLFNFGGNTGVQTAVEKGLWQGATYYKPDVGTESLVAAIGGRLFQFTPDATSVFQVVERTIVGDPNPATTNQAWLWQAENYVIWQDGQSFPVFFNGTSSVRSLSDQRLLGTTSLSFNAPSIGQTVPVTLTAPFLGFLGQSVLIDGATYQVVQPPGTSSASLTNVTDTAGNVYPVGTPVYLDPKNIGYNLFAEIGIPILPNGASIFGLSINQPYTGAIGALVTWFIVGYAWQVIGASGSTISLKYLGPTITGPFTIPANTLIQYITSPGPVSQVAVIAAPFTAPSIGATAVGTIQTNYVGPAGAIVTIGTSGIYTITAIPPAPPGTGLTLKNINDTPTTVHNAPAQLLSVPQLPPGRMGAYGLGRNWMARADGRTYVASDIVGGSSGTVQLNFRDAVLNMSENLYIAGGGFFTVPGSVGNITSLTFAATLDSSLGQGPLQIGTPTVMFSCNAPVERSTWAIITNPIQTESLIGQGPLSQNSTLSVNSDILFRSGIGAGSLILARREFATWGNTPISEEVKRILDQDNKALLGFGSAIEFDNRWLLTATPIQGPQGVYHENIVAINLDPISSLRGKSASIWEGQWTGLNVLQLLTGKFNGVDRAFAFCWNLPLAKIELYELMPTSTNHFDNDTVPVIWSSEFPIVLKDPPNKARMYKFLEDGEISVKNIVGRVDFKVQYRSDSDPCWHDWHEWSICGTRNDPLATTTPLPNLQEQYRPRMAFGRPDHDCDSITDKPYRAGYWYQLRVLVQGHCRIIGVRVVASPQPEPEFKDPICGDETINVEGSVCPPCQTLQCTLPDDTNTYTINGGTLFQNPDLAFPIPIPPGQYVVPAGSIKFYLSPAPISPLRLLGCQCEIVQSIEGKTTAEIAIIAQGMVTEAARQLALCRNPLPTEPFFNEAFCTNLCASGLLVNVNVPSSLPPNVFLQNGLLCIAGGAFTSTISQADAQQRAESFLNQFLQRLLNEGQALCGYWNTEQIVDCGGGITVTVPAFTTFSTASQADADAAAVAQGESQCGGTCDGSDTNIYALSPYSDGDIANTIGAAPTGGETIFTGVMPFKITGGDPCFWTSTWSNSGVATPRFEMSGRKFQCCEVFLSSGVWTLRLWSNSTVLWLGLKTSGTTPAGVYTYDSGADLGPASLTVVSNGPSVTMQPVAGCNFS